MSALFRIFQVTLLIFISLTLMACNDLPKDLLESSHRFEGRLISGSFPGSKQTMPGETFEIQMVPQSQRAAKILARSLDQSILFDVGIKVKRWGGLSLKLPYLQQPITLKKSDLNIDRRGMSHCFSGREIMSVSLCLGERDFSLVISELSGKTNLQIYGGASSRTEFTLEEPRQITLTMAVDRALNKSFQSLYDFETTLQAHNTSMANMLNLIPHFRFTNAVGIYTMANPVLISSVGDWAPFLIPTRWTRAIESRNQDYASRLGFQILQANLAQQVQMLALVLKQDQRKLEHIRNIITRVDQFLELVKEKVSDVEEQPAVLSILAYREALDLEDSQMSGMINNDRAALSQAMGYFNPKAVQDIEIDVPFLSIDDPKVYSSDELAGKALTASLELQQLQFVKDALRAKKGSLGLNWLDPAGSADTALGFNLIPQMKNISSEVRQIEIKSDLIRQQIHQASQQIERSTFRAKTNLKEILETLHSEKRKMQSFAERIQQGPVVGFGGSSQFEIAVYEIVKSLKTVLELKFEQESAILNWELAQVKEERLLFMQRARFLPAEARFAR